MRAVSAFASCKPAFSVGLHFSVVADVESSLEDVCEAPCDDGAAGKEVVVCSFYPLSYKRQEFCLTIFQLDEV